MPAPGPGPRAVELIGPDGTRLGLPALLAEPGPRGGPVHGSADGFLADFVTVLRPVLRSVLAGTGELELTTSGSTGRPRVVRRTAASWAASLPALRTLTRLRAGQLVWAPGPASSTLTLYAVVHALAGGASALVSGPGPGVPDAVRARVREASQVHTVPVLLDRMLDAVEPAAVPAYLRDWRVAVLAGGHCPPDLRRRCTERGLRVVEYYGSAELSFVAADGDGTGLRPFPGVELRLRDGVLWARSPYLATSVDGVAVADAEGWGTSGDRAVLTDAGAHDTAHDTADDTAHDTADDAAGGDPAGRRLRLLGRSGSAQVAGHTVHLAEVEAVLAGTPGVREVVCLAVPDPLLGQRILALVEPRDGADPVPALRVAAAGLPVPSRPARHRVVTALPRTPAGKVDRVAVERAWTTW